MFDMETPGDNNDKISQKELVQLEKEYWEACFDMKEQKIREKDAYVWLMENFHNNSLSLLSLETQICLQELAENHMSNYNLPPPYKDINTQALWEVTENISNMNYESFMQLDISERYSLLTTPGPAWYNIIDFWGNTQLEKAVNIRDIIPEEFLYVFILRNKEFYQDDGRPEELNHFWIYEKVWDDFTSILKAKGNNRAPVIISWYLISPQREKPDIPESAQIFQSESDLLWEQLASNNETVIRAFFWEKIQEIIDTLGVEMITPELVYAMFAQESKFNPNAVSPTGTRGIAMITGTTYKYILEGINKWKWYLPENLKILGEHADLETMLYEPQYALTLGINYIAYLTERFPNVPDSDLQRDLVILAYNMWVDRIKKIYTKHASEIQEDYSALENKADLVRIMQALQANMKEDFNAASQDKWEEWTSYLRRIHGYIARQDIPDWSQENRVASL